MYLIKSMEKSYDQRSQRQPLRIAICLTSHSQKRWSALPGRLIETAFLGKGELNFFSWWSQNPPFPNQFARDGMPFIEPSTSFSNNLGVVPTVGLWRFDWDRSWLVTPTRVVNLWGRLAPASSSASAAKETHHTASLFDFPFINHIQLSEEHKEVLWQGNNILREYTHFSKDWKRKLQDSNAMLSPEDEQHAQAVGKTTRKETRQNHEIDQYLVICSMMIPTIHANAKLTTHEMQIAERLLVEINNRLDFLCEVGLSTLHSTESRIACPAESNESTWQPAWQ